MQAIARIPKVLERVQQLRGQKSIAQVFHQYKKNVKIFVQNVKQEISQLIDNYEAVISQLKAQNKRLKESSPSNQFVRTNPSAFSPSKQFPTAYSTKLHNTRGLLDNIQTAKSNVFFPQGSKRLSPVLKQYNNQQNSCFSNQMNPQGQSYEKQTSRFQVKNQRKKHRQQQIRHFLESGNKSMNFTTKRFMQAIGKGEKDKRYFAEEQEQSEQIKLNIESTDSKNDSGLNRSLSAVCESLDNSFISKKARSQRDKRLNKMEEDLQKKRKQQQFVQEMVKQKGLKSLLKRLRDNVESSPKQIIAPIKASKLISSQKQQLNQSKISRKNSKVMINPVPIDIQKKSKATRKDQSISPTSPTKKPQSILKNSTILTRSIEGISAIDFVQ